MMNSLSSSSSGIILKSAESLSLNSLESFFLGAIFTLISSIVIQLFIYLLNKQRDKEERKENFRLTVYKLKIEAAQIAYQYIFKIYRAQQETLFNDIVVDSDSKKRLKELLIEARDWLDGQALILGDKIHTKVFTYFNYVGREEQYDKMNEAQKALRSILKEELVEEA